MNIIQRLRWSLGRGNPVVPSRWQATLPSARQPWTFDKPKFSLQDGHFRAFQVGVGQPLTRSRG
jgi:hypothetical protein